MARSPKLVPVTDVTPNPNPSPTTADPDPELVSRAPKLGFSAPLDGLRAVPLFMVLLVHAAYEVFGSFAASVDMFFVVSGFLIVTLLMEEHRSTGDINLRQFYLRRALRLFPALYTTIVITLVALLAVGGEEMRRKAIEDAWAAGLYVYHVVHPVHQEVVNGGAPEIRPLVHLWSLSVEEHFYLIVAVGMMLVFRRRWLVPMAWTFVAIWVAIGVARITGHVGPRFAWYQRPDSLLLGVVAAVVNARLLPTELTDRHRVLLRRTGLAAAAALVGVVWLGTKFAKPFGLFIPFIPESGGPKSGLFWPEFGFSVVALCCAVVVLSVTRVPESRMARALAWKPLVNIGRRSYVLYLLHVPMFIVLFEIFGENSPWLLLYLPLWLGMSELMHRYIEKPAMKLRHRFQRTGASGV